MPFIHGRNTTVLFNEFNASPYLTSAGVDIQVDTADTSTFGKGWKTSIPGIPSATLPFSGLYDPTFTELRDELSVDSGVLTFSPGGGSTVGDRARLALVTATNYTESSPVGGVVAVNWAAQSQAALGLGWMLHPLAEDTNTTVGTERDDTAATATGWTAHLHVLAVDGGSWVIKLEDAAVSNTYSDVSGGAFTAATGVTSQRLTSAAGATLRRYVRYTATRTGGSVGNGITFALAYSRNL
jgi:hypothetical protein